MPRISRRAIPFLVALTLLALALVSCFKPEDYRQFNCTSPDVDEVYKGRVGYGDEWANWLNKVTDFSCEEDK